MEIYDTSDVQRMLFQLSERRRKQKEEQTKRVQGGTKIATEGFKMWSKDQSIKTAELLNEGAALNPEYRDAGFVKRTFTPASERVTFDPSTTQGTDIGTVSPAGTVPPVTAPPAGAAPPVTATATEAPITGTGYQGGVGTALSAYDTVSSWNKHTGTKHEQNLKRGRDVAATAMQAASMIPTPASPFLMAGSKILQLSKMFV